MSESTELAPIDDRFIPKENVGKLESNYYCRGWNAKRLKYCGRRAGTGTAHPGTGRCLHHGGQKRGVDARITSGRRSIQGIARIRKLVDVHLADPNPFDVSRTLAMAKALMDDFIERYYELLPALMAWYDALAPLPEDQRLALKGALDELENLYGDAAEVTDAQREQLSNARAAVAHLGEPAPEKPRKMLDISDAVRHADTISKIIHRVNLHHAQNAVSYARLSSFLFELSRELDGLVPDREQLQKINDRIMDIRI